MDALSDASLRLFVIVVVLATSVVALLAFRFVEDVIVIAVVLVRLAVVLVLVIVVVAVVVTLLVVVVSFIISSIKTPI